MIVFAATGVVARIDFADKLVFGFLSGWAMLVLMRQSVRFNKVVAHLLIWVFFGFVIALFVALANNIPLLVSSVAFWQIWRAHISLIIGIALLSRGNKLPDWPVVLVLQFNMIFGLLQPLLGESLMTALYPVGNMEYRSGILRSVGVFGNPNTNAFFVVLYLLYVWKQFLIGVGGRSNRFLLALSFLSLFVSGSRTAILVLPFFMSYIAWRSGNIDSSRKGRSKVRFVGYLSGMAMVLGIAVYLSVMEENSTSTGYSLIPNTAVIMNVDSVGEGHFRSVAMINALRHFAEQPLTGLGYGTYGSPASFSWPSPFLEQDGMIFEDWRGGRLSQLDMLFPVILAESGLLGLIIWSMALFKIMRVALAFQSTGSSVFIAWVAMLLLAMFTGPGITHPVVVVLLPFVMAWLLQEGVAFPRKCVVY